MGNFTVNICSKIIMQNGEIVKQVTISAVGQSDETKYSRKSFVQNCTFMQHLYRSSKSLESPGI